MCSLVNKAMFPLIKHFNKVNKKAFNFIYRNEANNIERLCKFARPSFVVEEHKCEKSKQEGCFHERGAES